MIVGLSWAVWYGFPESPSLFIPFLSLLPSAGAVSTMASCPASYDWARNAQGMDPCEVATRLKAVCRQDPALSPISGGQSYSAPTAQDQTVCSCSSPVYYLVSACADCQGGSFGSWSNWAARCSSPAVNYFPRPAPNGVTIPNWAYFDVGTIRSFNPAFAKANSPSPPVRPTTVNPTPTTTSPPQNTPQPNPPSSSTPTPAPSANNPNSNASSGATSPTSSSTNANSGIGTGTRNTSGASSDTSGGNDKTTGSSSTTIPGLNGSPTQATSSSDARQSGLNAAYSSDTLTGLGNSRIDHSQPTDSSGNPIDSVSGSKKSNAGAIAGGVIGGLLFLAIICGLAYWLIMRRRRRRSRMAPSAAYLAAYGSNRPDTSMSSRPLADRSTSVLDLTHGHADSYSPYRDDFPGSTVTVNAATSQVQFSQARASSLDHYQRPT